MDVDKISVSFLSHPDVNDASAFTLSEHTMKRSFCNLLL